MSGVAGDTCSRLRGLRLGPGQFLALDGGPKVALAGRIQDSHRPLSHKGLNCMGPL